jgi:hypothetical protein
VRATASFYVGYRTKSVPMGELVDGQFVPGHPAEKSEFQGFAMIRVSHGDTSRVKKIDLRRCSISDKYFDRDA